MSAGDESFAFILGKFHIYELITALATIYNHSKGIWSTKLYSASSKIIVHEVHVNIVTQS